MSVDLAELVQVVRNHGRVRGIHIPAVMIGSESDGRVEGSLQIALVRIHFQEFEQSFGAELGLETALKGIFRFFFVLQA